jgi:hypothetical protein
MKTLAMFENIWKFIDYLFNMRAITGFAEIQSEILKGMKTHSYKYVVFSTGFTDKSILRM